MEPPASFLADAVRDEQTKVLRAIQLCMNRSVRQHCEDYRPASCGQNLAVCRNRQCSRCKTRRSTLVKVIWRQASLGHVLQIPVSSLSSEHQGTSPSESYFLRSITLSLSAETAPPVASLDPKMFEHTVTPRKLPHHASAAIVLCMRIGTRHQHRLTRSEEPQSFAARLFPCSFVTRFLAFRPNLTQAREHPPASACCWLAFAATILRESKLRLRVDI
jgi:hypothetical protein